MSVPLRVLLVEDSEEDAALALLKLEKSLYEPNYERVDTAVAMQAALDEREWDIILSDYRMPNFSGATALKLLRETGIDIPFIIISGTIGEETAVEMMKAGAHDYLMKDNLTRLAPAIQRELREAEGRRAQRRAEDDLRLAAKVFDSSVEGVMITDATAHILRVNQAFTDITGYTEDEVTGKKPGLLQSGRHPDSFYRGLWLTLTEQGCWQGEIWNRRKNGEIYPEWLTISAVSDEASKLTHYIGGFTDLSQQKQSEERIYHLSHYDALTDLPNQIMFSDHFTQSMQRAHRDGKQVALLHLDLDRFSTLNDTFGQHVGDKLLQQVGNRLTANIRHQDMVARLGSDKFAIALPGLDRSSNIRKLVQDITDAFAEPFKVMAKDIYLTGSMGAALYPDDSTDYNKLARFADTAMHHTKHMGGAGFQFYQKTMSADTSARLNMENDLRRALERKEFRLYYQPQMAMESGHLIGVEALLRWQHNDDDLIMPSQFIPLLEETGLIIPVGEWILRQACWDQQAWAETGHDPVPVAINLSARQFRNRDLIDMIHAVLKDTGTDPRLIELEITESNVMDEPEFALRTLQSAHNMGMRIAIDDFGTGYSSLSYLKQFPIDLLKIDQSFVTDIPDNTDDCIIVDTIVAMAHRLKLHVIAEGVENADQLEFLRNHGCDYIQGNYYGRPLPFTAVQEQLAAASLTTHSSRTPNYML